MYPLPITDYHHILSVRTYLFSVTKSRGRRQATQRILIRLLLRTSYIAGVPYIQKEGSLQGTRPVQRKKTNGSSSTNSSSRRRRTIERRQQQWWQQENESIIIGFLLSSGQAASGSAGASTSAAGVLAVGHRTIRDRDQDQPLASHGAVGGGTLCEVPESLGGVVGSADSSLVIEQQAEPTMRFSFWRDQSKRVETCRGVFPVFGTGV